VKKTGIKNTKIDQPDVVHFLDVLHIIYTENMDTKPFKTQDVHSQRAGCSETKPGPTSQDA
jgi:hypothetical protein